VFEDGRAVGIRGHERSGAEVVERASMVIGADGMRSLVAREVSAPSYREHPSYTSYYFAYWSGVPLEHVELYVRPNRIIIAFPTNDGDTCILVGWTNAEFHEYRANIEGNYLATLELAPDLGERVRNGQRASRFMGTADLPNFFRHPVGPGWALVGDAGLHRDPITAQGIVDAFRDAELLSSALGDAWNGSRSLDDALADYHRRRDEAAIPIYDLTCQLATLAPPPPEMLALLGALPGNQPQTDRFVGVIAGTVSPADFFAPENGAAIMQRAADATRVIRNGIARVLASGRASGHT
jgi:2-polyprenyl-6-methoxyphenol hydroxylase-like FAD-dependent oxidoreductase